MGELEEQGDGPCERAALDLRETGGRTVAACPVAAGDRQAGGGDLHRDERGRAECAVGQGLGGGMVPDRGPRPQRPARGGLPHADRRCGGGARHSPRYCRRAHRLDRRWRHRDAARRRADRGGPGGDRRPGGPVARRPADPRPDAATGAARRARPAGLRRRHSRQDLPALSAALLARAAEMVWQAARRARPARHLQHLGEPRAGDRPADPAQLQQRPGRDPSRP